MTTGVGTAESDAPGDASLDRRRAYLTSAIATATAIAVFGPILYYMVIHWRTVDDYSHGFLIAPLAIYFAWERRGKLTRVPISPSWWGLVPLALGAISLAVGRLGVELMAMRVGFVLTVIGLQILLLGIPVFRVMAFPLLFLFLMVPLPQSLVNVITFPLQLIATDMAVDALYHLYPWLGISAFREGNIIHLAESQLLVAEACSGLRSVMALGTLAIVFAYFFRRNPVERVIIVVSALPIAILVNAFRVGLTACLTDWKGPSFAEGAIHTTEGFFTFSLAFAALLLEAWLLKTFWPVAWSSRSGRARETSS